MFSSKLFKLYRTGVFLLKNFLTQNCNPLIHTCMFAYQGGYNVLIVQCFTLSIFWIIPFYIIPAGAFCKWNWQLAFICFHLNIPFLLLKIQWKVLRLTWKSFCLWNCLDKYLSVFWICLETSRMLKKNRIEKLVFPWKELPGSKHFPICLARLSELNEISVVFHKK